MRGLYSLALMGALLGSCAYHNSDKSVSESNQEVSLTDSIKTVVEADNLDGLKALIEAHTLPVLDLALRDSEIKACTVLELVCLLGKEKCADYLLNTLKVNPNYLGRSGWAPINRATRGGHEKVLALLIQTKADVNIRDAVDKDSALSLVFGSENSKRITELLLEAQADPNSRNWSGFTSLHWAVTSGYLPDLVALLKKGAAINRPDDYQETVLYWAVLSGQPGIIAYLLANGANPSLPNAKACLPLAAKQGNFRAVQLLLAYGASPEERDLSGKTALELAANTEIRTLLEGYTAKKVLYDRLCRLLEEDNTMALSELLASHDLIQLDALVLEIGTSWNRTNEPATANLQALAVKKGARECEAVIAKAAELKPSPYKQISQPDNFFLLGAAASGNLKLVQELLLAEADPSKASIDGVSALQAAILCGNTGVTAYLLANLSEEKRSETLSASLLQSACERGLINEIKLLLAYGAKSDISQEGLSSEVKEVLKQFAERKDLADNLKECLKADNDRDLKKLIHTKGLERCNDVLSEFKDNPGEASALHFAVSMRAVDCVGYLCEVARADINRECDVRVPLVLLLAKEDEENEEKRARIFDLLLEAGADKDFVNANQSSLLLLAAYNGDSWFCRNLLEKGADARISNMYGWSPVYAAIEMRDEAILDVLCDPKYKSQVDVNSEGHNGYSPLLLAATFGSSSMVGKLLKAGARTYSERYPQNVPLIHAVRFGNYECVRLLLEHGADRSIPDDAGNTALYYAKKIPGNTRLVALLESP